MRTKERAVLRDEGISVITAETHWNFWDEPRYRATVVAACGERVDVELITAAPSCPTCQEVLAAYEAEEID